MSVCGNDERKPLIAASPAGSSAAASNACTPDNGVAATVNESAAAAKGQRPPSWCMDAKDVCAGRVNRHTHPQLWRSLPRKIKAFYRRQNETIDQIAEADGLEAAERREAVALVARNVRNRIVASAVVNVLLTAAKAAALALSGSLSVSASLTDSALDLFTSLVISLSAWYIQRRAGKGSYRKFPVGKRRLETVAVIVCACVMASAAVQLIVSAVEKITTAKFDLRVSSTVIALLGSTVVSKMLLFLYCRTEADESASVRALSTDHLNDTVSNAVALIMSFVGARKWPYADPIGSIIVALWIIFNWTRTGWQQVLLLTPGVPVPACLMTKYVWTCANHRREILAIERLDAWHMGQLIYVEAHVVLPRQLPLAEAHDVGESLRDRLEMYEEVERAFVHLDVLGTDGNLDDDAHKRV